MYKLIDFPEIQTYQMYDGFDDNSYLCAEISGAYFVDEEFVNLVDSGKATLASEYR